jgi:hypothetical protein
MTKKYKFVSVNILYTYIVRIDSKDAKINPKLYN